MQSLRASTSVRPGVAAFGSGSKLLIARPSRVSSVRCRAEKLPTPEWVPEPLLPVVNFLGADDFKLEDSDVYKQYLQKYAENEWVKKSVGFTPISEILNGRVAMLGFVGAAGAEIVGRGSALHQLSAFPQPVLLAVLLVTVGTFFPLVKGAEGDYLQSLRETNGLPEGVFTEPLEKFHGRVALLGFSGLLLIELIKGSALL